MSPKSELQLGETAFCVALSAAIKERQMPQAALAKLVGCTPQYISQLKSGERPPSREILERIAHVLMVQPTELDPGYRKNQVPHFKVMHGIDLEYLAAAMRALRSARIALLAQTPVQSQEPGAGKEDAKVIDAVTERAIANELWAFNTRCMILTEEAGILTDNAENKKYASSLSYVIDPFDRSRPFLRSVRQILNPEKHKTLADIVADPMFKMNGLEAPSGSITCVREGEVIFNAMIDYAHGSVYVACKGWVGHGNIDECPDPRSLVERGNEITFSPRSGNRFLCFLSDQDKEKEVGLNEQASKYKTILSQLGFQGSSHTGFENPGGPLRILYLSDLNKDPNEPSLIFSNGEKIFEFLGWLAFAIHSEKLAVYELYSPGFEARGLVLQCPPPPYSIFTMPENNRGFLLDLDRLTNLMRAGHYRGAIAVTHSHTTVACATMMAKKNSRELYHPIRRI